LYYNWHRYYKPTLGRYYQADPIRLRGGINLYTYVKNNPLTVYDISGLKPLECVTCPGGYWSAVMGPPTFSLAIIYGMTWVPVVYTCKTNGKTCAGEITCRLIGPIAIFGIGVGGGEVFNAYTAAGLAGKSKGFSLSALPISIQLTFGESIANEIDIAKSVGAGVAYITCDVKIVGCL